MALLTQADYDALVPQLVNGKRTSGANSGKRIKDVVAWRGYMAPDLPSGDPPANISITYVDGVLEILSFGAGIETYPPGR